MKQITLADGSITQVSDVDYEFLSRFEWHQSDGYVITTLKMHHVVAQRAGMVFNSVIDHRDRDTKNNQRENLRPASRSQNRANSKRNKNNKTGFKGVFFDKRRQRFCASIRVNRKLKHLGYFNTAKEAHDAYCRAAEKHFGTFANAG